MSNYIFRALGVVLLIAPIAASAQTYDVNVQEGIDSGGVITPNVNDLTGSFTYNAGVFSNINVQIDGQGAIAPVQTITGGATSLLFSYTDMPSDTTFYSFDINHPLSGSATTISVSDVVFSPFDSLQFGNDVCGGTVYGQSGPNASTYTCSGSLTKVPEIDPASAAGGLALLIGAVAVLRGRRAVRSWKPQCQDSRSSPD
jgi:hypothetical protein